jgi:hypothetical protein
MQSIESILSQELEQAYNSDLDGQQSTALAYYDGEPGQVAPGWSDLVSTDVREAIESTVSEIMSAIDTNEPLAYFDPENEADTERAEAETWAVHDAIFGKNRGAVTLESSIRDALLQRYGIIKAWIEVKKEVTTQTWEITEMSLAQELSQQTAEHTIEVLDWQPAGDNPGQAKVRITDTSRRFIIDSIAPENFRWSSDLISPWLDDARFFAERTFKTRAQLEDLGAHSVDDASPGTIDDPAILARYETQSLGANNAAREEDELLEVWLCWLRNNSKGGYDCYYFQAPGLILKHEWHEFHPYAAGVTTLRPHRFDGVSLFDRIGQVQKSKTYLLRQLATQARLTNQNRLAIRDRGVNPDDVASDALNPVIRCTSAPGENLMSLPVQDITSQLLATMQWLDNVRREDGGASIDMTSPQMQIAGQSAHAAERNYSFREMQSQQILKTIGDTFIRSLYLLTHATLRAEMQGPMMVRRKQEWIQADPQQFPERTRLSVDVGSPMGVKARRMSALQGIIMQQQQVLMSGGAGLLVSLPDMYRAQVDFAKMAGLQNAERYWQDPNGPEAQAQAQQQAQQQQAQAQAQQQAQQAMIEAAAALEQAKNETQIALQHMKGQQQEVIEKMKVQQAYFQAILDAKAKGQEIDAQILIELQKAASESERTAEEASDNAED